METKPFPIYRCHKIVGAFKISGIDADPTGANLSSREGHVARVDAEFLRINPRTDIGGYFVVYSDGYQSFSPSEPFEAGYTLISVDEAAPDPEVKPRRGLFDQSDIFINSHVVIQVHNGTYWHVDPDRGEVREILPRPWPRETEVTHHIGWAVKQLWGGSRMRRKAWPSYRVIQKVGDDIVIFASDQGAGAGHLYTADHVDLLSIDWEVVT